MQRRGGSLYPERIPVQDNTSAAIEAAYQQGRRDALDDLRAVNDVAAALGVTRSYVHRLSRDRGIGRVIGRERLFTPGDVEALRAYMATDRRRRP